MFELAIASRALAGPGQDVSEHTVDEIVRLAQAAELRAAAERATQVIGAGGTDIRAIVALLLGVFDERGPAALPEVLALLTNAVGPRWGALRPVARRDRLADSALCLFLRSVRTSMDFHESARDATWRAWTPPVGRDLTVTCREAARALDAAIAERIAAPRSATELAGLMARAEVCLQRLPPPAAPEAPAPADAPIVAAEPEPVSEPPAEESPRPPPAVEPPRGRTMEISPALELFSRKLDAFAELVERGDMSKAAIVAQDIKATVDHFDPRLYLPRLLAPFFRLLSAHVGAIAPHWGATESAEWHALEQLYRVDLDAFLEP